MCAASSGGRGFPFTPQPALIPAKRLTTKKEITFFRVFMILISRSISDRTQPIPLLNKVLGELRRFFDVLASSRCRFEDSFWRQHDHALQPRIADLIASNRTLPRFSTSKTKPQDLPAPVIPMQQPLPALLLHLFCARDPSPREAVWPNPAHPSQRDNR